MNEKIEGVKDSFKILEERCKKQKKVLDIVTERQNNGCYWYFEDNGASLVNEERAKLDILVSAKIDIEKYMRKLKHEERRKNESIS